MTPSELPGLTIAELQKLLRSREVSPREVLEALQERIETLDPDSTPIFRGISTPRSTPPRRPMSTCR